MKIIQWLKRLFTKESKPMTEPVTTEQPAVSPETLKTDVERFEEKLKELVTAAGSQAHAVFDDLCKLAKQLI